MSAKIAVMMIVTRKKRSTADITINIDVMDATRIDKYLWAIRVFKTRADATDACRGGRVTVNGNEAKPSKEVKTGDTISIRKGSVYYTYKVLSPLDKRQGAKEVEKYAQKDVYKRQEMTQTLRNLRYYAPSLRQSWLLVLIFVLFGTTFGATPKLLAGDSTFWGSTSVMYLCTMIPVFFFICFKAMMEYQRYEVTGMAAPSKINFPSFGSLHPLLVFLLAGLATLCISVLIGPLTTLIPMPDSIRRISVSYTHLKDFSALFSCTRLITVLMITIARMTTASAVCPKRADRKAAASRMIIIKLISCSFILVSSVFFCPRSI